MLLPTPSRSHSWETGRPSAHQENRGKYVTCHGTWRANYNQAITVLISYMYRYVYICMCILVIEYVV